MIKKAQFKTSIADLNVYFDVSNGYSCPEICVLGRSNVGKSSFINMLAMQNKLAKTSATPGRTRLINLFEFNGGEFMLVDLLDKFWHQVKIKSLCQTLTSTLDWQTQK